MPFMVSLATTDGRLSVERAGLLGSSYMAGLLAATIGLPTVGCRRVTARAAFACIPCLATALWLGETQGEVALLIGWIVIGAICGLFQFLGSTSAASYPDRHFVLGLRLALVLLASSAVIGIGGLLGGFGTFGGASLSLASSFALCSLIGLIWYRQPPLPDKEASLPRHLASKGGRWSGLIVVLVFFAGQVGFSAYAAHLAIRNGVSASELPLTYALCKAVGACALLKWGISTRSGSPTFLVGAALGASLGAMALSHSLAWFAIGLLVWEVTINLQSTRLQAIVLSRQPVSGGLWLPAAIAAGGGIGPSIHGALIGQSAEHWFLVLSLGSAILPAAWASAWRSAVTAQR